MIRTAPLALLLLSSAAFAQSARDPIPLEKVARPGKAGAAGKAQRGKRGAKSEAGKPKLVVILVVDQFRLDYLERFNADLGEGGFRRLLREGASYDARYGQQNTYTGPGHALIASGSYAYANGIMQNKWWNRATGRSESMLFDAKAVLHDGSHAAEDETSPRNFSGSTIGDELLLASPRSKVVTLALKDRGAILLGGRMGQAYFQSEQNGDFIASTYYGPAVPDWVRTFNAQKLADQAFGKTWDRALPADRYPERDDHPNEGDVKGMGRAFPHKLTGKLKAPGPDYYSVFQHSPYGLDLTFAFARAALDAEKLGQRGVTDLLGVSITPTDYVGHTFGPYSQEVHDIVVRTDRALEGFLRELDRRFGGEVLVVLTADHGATPVPEWSTEHKLAGHRVKKAQIKEAVDKALAARFGEGKWVIALEDPSVYLDWALIDRKKLDHAEVERVAGEAAIAVPGIQAYFTRTQLQNGWLPPTPIARAVARSYVPTRSGDVVLLQAPFSFWGKYGERDWGDTHGSPYRYDTDVPLVFMGKGVVAGRRGQADMVDVAATLARRLGLPMPAACEGEPLPIDR